MGDALRFPGPPALSPERGRLLSPADVAALIGGVSQGWVRRNVPGKLTLGHSTVRWREHDVWDWIETRRESA